MAANNPKHGDPIVRESPDPLGGTKLIATRSFQRFLDDLGLIVNDQNDDAKNVLLNLTAQIGRLKGVIQKQDKELECLRQEFHGS
jgi:hypothetical protein